MHDVQALIANAEHLQRHIRRLRAAVLCGLPQGMALLPLTEAVAVELALGPQAATSALPPARRATARARRRLLGAGRNADSRAFQLRVVVDAGP